MQLIRSLAFNAQMYVAMAVIGVLLIIPAFINRAWAYHAIHFYCRYIRWTAAWMVGLKSEVRGTPPTGQVLVASKHQSFFDIIVLVSVLPRPKFIMKKELTWAPVLGWYAWLIGCVPVDRGKRGAAIDRMKKNVLSGQSLPGQLIIYPQGTRVAPGVKRPFKVGSSVLYEQLGQPCVPVACNVGVFWPRRAVLRKPGLAVVEFLPEIPIGMPQKQFMADLEEIVERESDRLMAEAGFRP